MMEKLFCRLIMLLMLLPSLSGCASIARGVTAALVDSKGKEVDARECYVRGRPYAGIDSEVKKRQSALTDTGVEKTHLKVLMVHGIGSHKPGYATQLSENLARELELPKVQENLKEINLMNPLFPDMNLGSLRVTRHFNDDGTREMLFYELTWDTIVEKEKETISFDNSGEYSYRRASINKTLKFFINDTVPDLVMYYGNFRQPIQMSIAQAMCWMVSAEWETLPDKTTVFCDKDNPRFLENIDDEYVFITHSLGSRITSDALQFLSEIVGKGEHSQKSEDILQNKEFTIIMLSNQLPLLQLGRDKPEVSGLINEICAPGAEREEERLFRELHFVAFSDPNDLFSYPIPPNYIDNMIDSRLCPTLTNVTLNVAHVKSLFGAGELANPLAAHTNYDNDERVIKLIVHGIGTPNTAPLIEERCVWTEAVPEKF